MKQRYLLTLLVATGLTTIITHKIIQSHSTPESSIKLTISAAISLKNALEEIKPVYETSHPPIKITYNFGSSGALEQQIENGAPIDIFISASTKPIDRLQNQQRLLEKSRQNLLTNQIVLITPKQEEIIKTFNDLTHIKIRKIALGEIKSVPAGEYGSEVLNYYKITPSIQSKIIYAKDVRQVLTYVETGNVNAGLVYITDAKTSNKVRIAAIAPEKSHSPIVYPIVILKDSKQAQLAKTFTQFLTSNQAQNIFKKYGFGKSLVTH